MAAAAAEATVIKDGNQSMKGKLLVDDCGYLVAGGRHATCSFFRKSDFTPGKRCYCRRDYFCDRVGNVATWNVQKNKRSRNRSATYKGMITEGKGGGGW